jgi:peptide/nickel transport system substrate-binding protein
MTRFFEKKWMGIQALALLFLGCTSATATPSVGLLPTAVPSATPVVSVQPVGERGGSLRVAGFVDIEHRDVHQSLQEALISQGPGLAYSRLLRLRTGLEVEQPSLLLECDLCESWRIAEDFSHYDFQLRPDVRWQNIPPVNGRLLVAEDLAYSYDRMRTPGWPAANLFSAFGSIVATGSFSLRAELTSQDSDALLSLADGHSKIVAREVIEEFGDLKDSPVVGTGPWIWEDTVQSEGTTLSRNPDYFEDGLPFLDELSFRIIKKSDVIQSADADRLAAFLAGTVDVLPILPQEWKVLQETERDLDTFVSKQAGTGVLLSMNIQTPALADPAVRRAILKAIDPSEYVRTIWENQGFVSVGVPVQQPDWLLSREELRDEHFGSPTEAAELVAAAADIQGQIEIEILVGDFGDAYLELGERVVSDLRAVGFNPIVRLVLPSQYSQLVVGRNKDYQVALGVLPPTSTTNSYLFAILHSGGQWNVSSHSDRVLDLMIEEQAAEFNSAKRQVQLRDIQSYVLDRAYLFSPVTGATRWVFNQNLKGFYPNTAASEYNFWSRTWLEQ